MKPSRWTIFAVLALSYVWVYFHRMAPAVVSGDLLAEFKITASQLGSLAAMYYYVSALTQIPSGVVADLLGTRIVVSAANLIAGIGSLVFGLALTFGEATLGRFLVGLGVSIVFVCFMKSNAAWFDAKQYGFISGLTLLIGNAGSVFAGSPLELVLRTYSWRTVFVVIGLASIALAALSALVIRNSPAEADAPFGRPAAQPSTAQGGWTGQLRSVLRNRWIWPGFVVNLGLLGSLYSFSGLWAIPYLRDVHGLQRGAGATLVTASLIGLALGSFCLGWLSDALGRRKPVLVGSVLAYTAVFAALASLRFGAGAGGVTLFFLLGFAGGGFVLTYALAKEITPVAQAGMAVSVVNTGVFLGASLIQPLYGLILDHAWSGQLAAGLRTYSPAAYAAANAAMLAAAVLALAASLVVRETGTAARPARAPAPQT